MEHQLSEEDIDRICANLRVIDLLRKHQDKFEEYPEMKKLMISMKAKVKEIMDLLTDEQRDLVLEIHKEQSEAIKKKLAGTQKNKNRK